MLPPRTLPSIVTIHTRSLAVALERTSRAIALNSASSGWPLTTTDELSELSITIASAVGACPAPTHSASGRAAANAMASTASTRRNIRRRFLIRSVRLCSFSARSRYRAAGKSTRMPIRRRIKWMSSGTAIAAPSAR